MDKLASGLGKIGLKQHLNQRELKMPLLREEAEKLSNNELEQGVIETIIDRDDLFAILPFMKIN